MNDLISRQAAIDALHMHLMYRMGTDSNKKRLDEWINNLPSAQSEQRWIPCSERLPETDEMMLVTAQPKKGAPNVNRAYYMDGYWHGSGSMSNVVAWMPLPEPYGGKQE